MKKTALLLAALLTTGASLSAADAAAPASSYNVTMDFTFADKYVFRGIALAEDSFQANIKVTSGAGYAGIWTNQPITKNTDNEIDFYAGYNIEVAQGWTVDLGATYYYYPEANTNLGLFESTIEAYAGINGAVGGVTVGFYTYYDFDFEAFTLQGSLGYSIPMNEKTSLNLSAVLGTVLADVTDYTYYSLGAQVPYKLTDSATITVGLNWASHDLTGVDDNNLWFNVGLTATF